MAVALEVGGVIEVEGTEEVLEAEDQMREDFVVEGVEGGMKVVDGRIEMIHRKINPTVGAKAQAVMLRDGNPTGAVGAKITITKAAGRVLIVAVMLMMVDGRKDSTLKRMRVEVVLVPPVGVVKEIVGKHQLLLQEVMLIMVDGRKDSTPKIMQVEVVAVGILKEIVGKHPLLLQEVHRQGGVSRRR